MRIPALDDLRGPRGRAALWFGQTLPWILVALVIEGVGGDTAGAATRVSVSSGRWSQRATWSSGIVPGPDDEVTIASGHQVEFDGPETRMAECARLTIQAGGTLVFAKRVMTFLVGGDGPGVRGGIDISGSMVISEGVTVAIDPDGNAESEEDGVTVHSGGSLTLQGSALHEGTVSTVLSDNSVYGISFIDRTLHRSPRTAPLRVVWRSGQRKGRWYDTRYAFWGWVSLDFRSRSNAERIGEPDYKVGTASVEGATVTGFGTDWTDAVAVGSWWWCEAEGPRHKIRVRRLISPTSLQLAEPYGPSACETPRPYVLRDENQPYPGVDVSERIAAGDRYTVILPAVLRSFRGSDDDFDEQIFVRVEAGGSYHFQYASFESVGKKAWEAGAGSGIRIAGFQGAAPPAGVFDTVEIYRYGGEAAIEWDDSSNFDVDWLFLHWAHPLITTPNEGHGIKIQHTSPENSADNVRIRNGRFDRTNDDFVWWSSTAGGTSGVYDSIGKYCPNTASGDSCDAVDTDDELGRTGGQLHIERNFFANIGAQDGGSCMSAALGRNTPQPGWTGEGWLARDNVCVNLQTVPCMYTTGGGHAWDQERMWAVNNVCVGMLYDGIRGIPHVFQNQILNFGASRSSSADGLRGVYEARGNVIWGAGGRTPEDSYVHRGASIGFSLELEANWAGTTWSLTDNLIMVTGAGVEAHSWSSAQYPSLGEAEVRHNTFLGNPLDAQVLPMVGILDLHAEPSDAGIVIQDNIFDFLVPPGSFAGQGFDPAASLDSIDRNVVHLSNPPYWGGFLTSQNDYAVTTGIAPLQFQFQLEPGSGAWTVVTSDGDKPGPRFAGTLLNRLPFQVPGLVPINDPDHDDADWDGDGLVNRWDNCPEIPNPGWADSDGNGVGDACQP